RTPSSGWPAASPRTSGAPGNAPHPHPPDCHQHGSGADFAGFDTQQHCPQTHQNSPAPDPDAQQDHQTPAEPHYTTQEKPENQTSRVKTQAKFLNVAFTNLSASDHTTVQWQVRTAPAQSAWSRPLPSPP